MVYRTLFSIIIFICLISCRGSKDLTSSKDEYIMAYKKAVLYVCINSATNGNFQTFSENNDDLGTAPEIAVIYHSDIAHAKALGIELSKKIRRIDYSDYQGKKPIFSDCVNFAFSKETDSIANEKYKELKNAKLEYK